MGTSRVTDIIDLPGSCCWIVTRRQLVQNENMWIRSGAALTGAMLLLSIGCSESPTADKAKPPEIAPEQPLTGRQAFQRMYPAARGWAADAVPIQLQSVSLQEVKAGMGKAGAWQTIFVSAALGKARSYTYSAVEAPGNLHQGVFAGPQESWAGPRGQEMPFDIAAIKTDSDEAYRAAAERSADYVRKNPNKPVSYLLERTNHFPNPAWRVIWGESVGTSDYSVFVDASTSKLLEILH